MNIIVCLDERNGMSFNNRRQSRDRAVITHILKTFDCQCIRMHPKSVPLFEGVDLKICACENYLQVAKENDWCFVETDDVLPFIDSVRQIVVYRWNRVYPFDKSFPIDQLNASFSQVSISDFPGYSHPVISVEVYCR